jgi:hypothetical protein
MKRAEIDRPIRLADCCRQQRRIIRTDRTACKTELFCARLCLHRGVCRIYIELERKVRLSLAARDRQQILIFLAFGIDPIVES